MIDPELLVAQFEDAAFPFWLVDEQVTLLSANHAAHALYPSHCLADGIRLFLSPHGVNELTSAIAAGTSIIKHSLAGLPSSVSLAFTPWQAADGSRGASVMLTPRVTELTVEGDLRRSLDGVGNLVITQGLRHSVNNILAALSAANSRLQAADIAVADDQLQSINHLCYRILRVSDNLSQTIQLSAPSSCATHAINFWDSCAELMEAVGTLLHGSGCSFTYTLPESNLYVACNWPHMRDSILNLISNCCLYGGQQVHITITGHDMAGRVHLTVADDGLGISPLMQQRLFQPFCSWDCLDLDNAGAGLGLFLVRSIVTEAGGTVTLNTTEQGTTVALSLPTCEPPADGGLLQSSSANYMQNRYSPVYIALCDVIPPPML